MEDFGWANRAEHQGVSYLMCVAGSSEEDSSRPNFGEWHVMLERHRSFAQKLLGKNRISAGDPIVGKVAQVLRPLGLRMSPFSPENQNRSPYAALDAVGPSNQMVELMQFRMGGGDLALRLSAHSQGLQLDAPIVTFRHGGIVPALPPGMSVTACEGILITLRPAIALSGVCVSARWDTPFPTDPSPTTGQRLDAQEWINDGQIVLLGTEDGDALAERLLAHGLDPDAYQGAYPVHYLPTGFDVFLPRVPAAAATTVHFVVAVNTYPEPAEDSAWFAVDVPHQRVLAELAG